MTDVPPPDSPQPGDPSPDINPTTPREVPQTDPGYPAPDQPDIAPGDTPVEIPPVGPQT